MGNYHFFHPTEYTYTYNDFVRKMRELQKEGKQRKIIHLHEATPNAPAETRNYYSGGTVKRSGGTVKRTKRTRRHRRR